MANKESSSEPLKCSFCGKSQKQVIKLIAMMIVPTLLLNIHLMMLHLDLAPYLKNMEPYVDQQTVILNLMMMLAILVVVAVNVVVVRVANLVVHHHHILELL